MRHLQLAILIFLLLNLLAFNSAEKHKTSVGAIKKTISSASTIIKTDSSHNKIELVEIQSLIRHMLIWAESKKSFVLVPVLTDSKDSLCIGFDLEKLKNNLKIFRSTGYFSAGFIDNYKQIILTLDKKIKSKRFAAWDTNELPPFNFANDVDPWTNCQDVPYDMPNAYGLVDVHVASLNKQRGELYWTWGNLDKDADPSWEKFIYKFKVNKEDGKWKISYLEGFDYTESVKFE